MTNVQKSKRFNLEERTLIFAQDVRKLVSRLPKTIQNNEDAKQLVRSSGAIGANYIEGNEALGKKDFVMRLRISRKEAKESAFWLSLLESNENGIAECHRLRSEAREIMLILTAIINKVS
ncbi:four helix bundle protein [Candidatus Kaiserbacteria bacterium]|nr:four helix bundle protein [Candidatus Kaiserbacteria bacterium]